ncbi:6-phosphogluconolactonase [Microcella sp.]|uniref:6-phosphogluconolactonase n=1 Tax=Microcella sp. TaxID=1913979 RepID=UPI00391B2242
MTTERRVLVHADRAALAGSVASRFLTKMIDLLDERDEVHLVLTGGSVGIEVLAAIAALPARDQIDWARVHAWWGDERWVPAGHADRNEQQARDALLDLVAIPASNIHAFPASDEGLTLEEGAERYRDELLAAGGGDFPTFAITFLGVGPDGHIASLFPERDGPRVTETGVIAVHDSPKPPPARLTLTLPLINRSERIWLVLAGGDKAAALGLALAGAAVADVPVGGVLGTKRTVFFIDDDASSEVPESLIAPTSYWTGAMDQAEWTLGEQ